MNSLFFEWVAFLFHFQTFFWTAGNANAAADAFAFFQNPCLCRSVYGNSLLRAFPGTEGAINAFGSIVYRLAAGSLFFHGGRSGFCKSFGGFLRLRFWIAGDDLQALFRANAYAIAALNAVKAVNRPSTCGAVNLKGAGRAGTGANTTGDAFFNFNGHMAAHPVGEFCRFKGVSFRYWLGKQIF